MSPASLHRHFKVRRPHEPVAVPEEPEPGGGGSAHRLRPRGRRRLRRPGTRAPPSSAGSTPACSAPAVARCRPPCRASARLLPESRLSRSGECASQGKVSDHPGPKWTHESNVAAAKAARRLAPKVVSPLSTGGKRQPFERVRLAHELIAGWMKSTVHNLCWVIAVGWILAWTSYRIFGGDLRPLTYRLRL